MDANAVHAALQHALHQNDEIRKPAELALKEYEKKSGFVSILIQIISERHQIDPQSRLMASICLKNLIQRHWKSRSRSSICISENEKSLLKQFLLSHMNESETQIATQLACGMSKIARLEQNWPVILIPTLVQYIQSGSSIEIYRAMYSLKRTLKELASKRLLMHKKAFYAMTAEFFPVLYQLWTVQQDQEVFYYSTKVLYYLIVVGYPGISQNPSLPSCWNEIHLKIQNKNSNLNPKTLVVLAKLVVETQKQHPMEFCSFLGPFLQLFYTELQHTTMEAKFLIQAVTFLSNVQHCLAYREEKQVERNIEAFLTPERKEELIQSLVLTLMQLDSTDLEDWQLDPEGFILTQESLTAAESLRSAAENLFLTMLQSQRQQLAPIVLQLLSQYGITSVERIAQLTKQDLLRTDAVYLAIGLASYDLHEYLEFEPWFLNSLVPCLQTRSNPEIIPVPVLRRRILWLIGCWMAQITESIRPPLYDALLRLLMEDSPFTDMAVKLTAIQTLQALLNDWEFKRDIFRPFIGRLIQAAYHVMGQTEQTETRLKIMELLQSMLNVCDNDILPHTQTLVAPLPELWQMSQEHNLVRGQILRVLSKTVTAAREHSVELHSGLLLPVLQYSTDVDQPDQVYLMDSGLELWQEVLYYATTLTPELLAVFQNLPKFMLRDFEHIKAAMKLIDSYLLLGGETFWLTYASDVARVLETVIGNVKPDGAAHICRILETCVRIFPPSALKPLYNVFGLLLDAISLARMDDLNREPDMVIIGYMTVLARVLFHAPAVFYALLESRANAHDTPQQLLGRLVAFYLDKYYSIVYTSVGPVRRKVWACAMCCFLSLNDREILERTGQILDLCVDVLEASKDQDRSDESTSTIEFEASRRSELLAKDPILQMNLHQLVCDRLTDCSKRIDPTFFQHLMQMVDQSVLKRFQS